MSGYLPPSPKSFLPRPTLGCPVPLLPEGLWVGLLSKFQLLGSHEYLHLPAASPDIKLALEATLSPALNSLVVPV